ncbi:MFS transporter [Ensifer sp. ENS10]|uniref:MFS transporter n=1 Tax=Ensifer sp. ENS10 TaxID=2769286 RepID=UPI0017830019|nr:MFS transporter [Ensifer sp. ENS10]MBD9509163.1 MFS transporter [Ensifer sp. ENS10]
MTTSNLWGCAAFRRISFVLVVHSFCSWMFVAALPLIVAARFGTGAELVGSLAFGLLPRIVFAPLATALLRRTGPRIPVFCAILGVATAIPGLAVAPDATTLQAIVFLIGLADTVITPGLLTLRAASVPPGRNMEANTTFQAIDRCAKIFGPPAAGLTAAATSIAITLIALALGHVVAATLLLRHSGNRRPREPFVSCTPSFRQEAIAIMRDNPLLWALLLPALGYMVSLGALQPFLFWLNRDQFHLGPEMWTVLLGAQGLGALSGALVSNRLARVFTDTRALLLAYLVASLFEGVSTFALIFAPNHGTATALLILGGIPEMVAFAAYFTLVQRGLPLERQTAFYALTLPLMDLGLAAGVLSGAMFTSGLMSLWTILAVCQCLCRAAGSAVPRMARARYRPLSDVSEPKRSTPAVTCDWRASHSLAILAPG